MNSLHSEHNGEHVPGLPSLSLAEFEALFLAIERIVEQTVKQAVREAMRPQMATLKEIAHDYRFKDTRTVKRRCKKYGIPLRNAHGDVWREGDDEIRISRAEWRRCAKLDTRTVKNIVRDQQQRRWQMKRTHLQSALNALPESAKIVEIKTTERGTLVRYRHGRSRVLEMYLPPNRNDESADR